MFPHHQQSISNVKHYFEQLPDVQALLLGGSIAHGFATSTSDVDIMIAISDEAYAQRLADGTLTFFNRELCTYPEGYVDGKYVTSSFLEQVSKIGSEPARFAFKDSHILFSRIAGLEQTLSAIARYPVDDKIARIRRFHAQLEAWEWYTGQAREKSNQYLLDLSINKLILFGGRLILAHNEVLYPYHKWFLRVLDQVQNKPETLMQQIDHLTSHDGKDAVDTFVNTIKNFRQWDTPPAGWGAQFLQDSELNWLNGRMPVDDI